MKLINMNKCIYCGKEFEIANQEHVLQNFLGGRLKSGNIACNDCQDCFSKFEAAGACDLQFIRNIICAAGNRSSSKAPTIKGISDDNGYTYNLLPGLKPVLSKPFLTRDGDEYKVQFSNWEMCNWAKHMVEEEAGTKNLHLNYVEQKLHFVGKLNYEGTLISDAIARSLIKSSINLFAINNKKSNIDADFSSVVGYIFDRSSIAKTNYYFRYMKRHTALPYDDLSPYAHQIYVYSQNNNICSAIRLYGHFSYVSLLCSSYDGTDFMYTYALDPLSKGSEGDVKSSDFSLEKYKMMPSFDDGAISFSDLEGNLCYELHEFMEKSFNKILEEFIPEYLSVNDICDVLKLPHELSPQVRMLLINLMKIQTKNPSLFVSDELRVFLRELILLPNADSDDIIEHYGSHCLLGCAANMLHSK